MRRIRKKLQWILLILFASFPVILYADCESNCCGARSTGAPVAVTEPPIAIIQTSPNCGVTNVPGSLRDCAPCGVVQVNCPPPASYESRGVIPYENYLATSERLCRGVSDLEGFYIGAGFGVGWTNINLKIGGFVPLFLQGDSKSYLTERVYVGYAYAYNWFFLALEAGYNYRSWMKPTTYQDFSTISIAQAFPPDIDTVTLVTRPCDVRLDMNSQNAGYVDLLPGFLFTPRFALYGRVGVEFTRFNWVRHVCFPSLLVDIESIAPPAIDDINVTVLSQDFEDTQKQDLTAFRLGAGFAFSVCPHISFNINYVHTFGRTITFTPNATAIAANISQFFINGVPIPPPAPIVLVNPLIAQNTINPSRNEVNFGITFTF